MSAVGVVWIVLIILKILNILTLSWWIVIFWPLALAFAVMAILFVILVIIGLVSV